MQCSFCLQLHSIFYNLGTKTFVRIQIYIHNTWCRKSHVLYSNGKLIPLEYKDFISFAKKNLLDTASACDELDCSRQNLSYMVKQGQLTPVKENVKGNLYLKGDVLKNKW